MNSKKSVRAFPRWPGFLKWAFLGMFLFIFPAMQAATANVDIKPIKILFDSQNRIKKLPLKNTGDTAHQPYNQNRLQQDSDPGECGCNQLLPNYDQYDRIRKINPKRRIDHEF
jgi:hypothetical protein